MMVPWLFLHALLIPSLPLMSLLCILHFNKIHVAALVLVPFLPYAYVWVALFNYRFQFDISTQILILPNPCRSKTIKTRTEDISLETGIPLKEDMTMLKIPQSQNYSIVPQNDQEYSVSSNHPDLYSR